MANPLGKGEKNHPNDGNAHLTTYDRKGDPVQTPLWISQFATDLNLQMDVAQARAGLIYRPVRMTERFLLFSTLWNQTDQWDKERYQQLISRIRAHWAYSLNSKRELVPMKLRYYGADKTWLGFIENADIGFAVTDVILTYTFQMRLIPSVTDKHSTASGKAPYAPTSQDAKDFGTAWYTSAELLAAWIGTNNESANGTQGKANDPVRQDRRQR